MGSALMLAGPEGLGAYTRAGRHLLIGLTVFGSRSQANDHGLGTVQRTAYPT